MARAEHEDWCRYYRDAGWRYGPARDDERKIHDKLVDWDTVEREPAFLDAALRSLAETLLKLRDLGYRSKPLWERYARAGTVSAEQRAEPWTWTSESGQTMSANAGHWAIWDTAGHNWSVRDDIFRTSYE
ncbi:MAG: RyR domain-containing protein, partial [Rhodococcus sp. (in: high G+C Gram-positive bacteria)]|uniref:RyR domain-containing protein n=1 Tax=Rhodococcus sp. TaxID=1831 RepID=UPI003BB0EEB0